MRFLKKLTLVGIMVISAPTLADISLTLSPGALDFGAVTVGTTASQNAVIGIIDDGNGNQVGNANNGNITSISIVNPTGSGNFTAAQDCVGTAFSATTPNDTCIIQVDCTPSTIGAMSAELEVQLQLLNQTPPDIQTIPLNCSGAAQPVPPPSAASIPTLSVWGLGILAALMGGIGFIRRRLG